MDSIYYSNQDPKQYLGITYDEIMGYKKPDEKIDADEIVKKIITVGGIKVE